MLGSQTWFTVLALPTVVVGGFIATRKRLAYQWREELMDADGSAYPSVTDAHMEFLRRVAPANAEEPRQHESTSHGGGGVVDNTAFGVPLQKTENIGLQVSPDVITPQEQNIYLNEVREWAKEIGNAPDPRRVNVLSERVRGLQESLSANESDAAKGGFEGRLPALLRSCRQKLLGGVTDADPGQDSLALLAEVDPDFYGQLRIISDHAEDTQLMRAPWGCGDKLNAAKMPSSLRYLVQTVGRAHEGLGRLRHVSIVYSPAGKLYNEPRTPKGFDGHDYVLVPLRRDGGDAVVTFTPVLRSKFSVLTEVMKNSWTLRDVDCLIPAGSALRVYGQARYDWGWGVRPGAVWFGSRRNRINRSIRADEEADKKCRSPTNSSHWWTGVFSGSEQRLGHSSERTRLAPGTEEVPVQDAAMIALHFEGPRSKGKQRSLLLEPESLLFGRPPTVEAFEKWVDDRPTQEDVRGEGLVRFIVKRYYEMLRVS